jgi:hypothetical protein
MEEQREPLDLDEIATRFGGVGSVSVRQLAGRISVYIQTDCRDVAAVLQALQDPELQGLPLFIDVPSSGVSPGMDGLDNIVHAACRKNPNWECDTHFD